MEKIFKHKNKNEVEKMDEVDLADYQEQWRNYYDQNLPEGVQERYEQLEFEKGKDWTEEVIYEIRHLIKARD